MKKLYSFVLIFLSAFIGLALFACNGKYDSMSMSATIFCPQDAQHLEDGRDRVSSTNGTFDCNPDGSYTLYIDRSNNKSCKVNVLVSFSGTPGDFSYGLVFEQTNEILNITSQELQNKVVSVTVSAGSVGQTKLTVRSAEGGKSASIYVNVVEINNNFSFKDDNIAMINERDVSLDLSSKVLKNGTGDLSFSFGTGSEGEFVEYSSADLVSNGLTYDSNAKVLKVAGNKTNYQNLSVKATLTNPLGETFSQYSTLHFIHAIQNLKIYKGTNSQDIVNGNLVSSDEIIHFVNNYASLNVVDFIAVVENNGQLVKFSVEENSYLENISEENIGYINNSGEIIDSVSGSVGAFCPIKMISNIKTTNLPDKLFSQVIKCDYANYQVDNYPISASFNAKVYDLVKNFSINGDFADNLKIEDVDSDTDLSSFDVYYNSVSGYKGAHIVVGLSSPIVVESEYAFYTLSLCAYDGSVLPSPESYFDLFDADGEKLSFKSDFRIGSELYVKPKTSTYATYFLCITSKYPTASDLKVGAVVKLNVCQGISSITKIDYSVSNYMIDGLTGEFILDIDGNKQVETTPKDDVGFDDNKVLLEDINLDIDVVDNRSEVKIYYEPSQASPNSLVYVIENENVATIVRESSKNIFYIYPVSVGTTRVNVISNYLTYSIPVNVFTPITNFYVFPSDSTSDNISRREDQEDSSLKSILVKSGVSVPLRLVTLPSGVAQYSLDYTIEQWSGDKYIDFDDNTATLSYEEILSGRITKKIKNGESFVYNLSDNSFIFNNLNVSKYRLTIKLQNNGGNVLSRVIELEGYNPSTISLSLTKKKIYNTSTVSYLSRFLGDVDPDSPEILTEINKLNADPTCFGVKVSETSPMGLPTYSFANCGQIRFFRNGLDEGSFALNNGKLVTVSSNLIEPVSEYEIAGYYYFRLKDNSHANPFSLVLEVSVKEQFSEENYNTIIKNSVISIANATKVSSIVANDDLNLSFNIDGDTTSTLAFRAVKENAFNKALTVFSYRVYNINSTNYFVFDEDFMQVELTDIGNGNYSLFVDASTVGKGRIILLPEDAITTKTMFLALSGKSQAIVLSSLDDFVQGLFFADSDLIVPVTSPQVGVTYYIKSISQDDFRNYFDVYSEVYVSVNDGSYGNEYEISSFEGLTTVLVSSPEYATKHYKIVKDIYADPSSNFSPLKTYYKIDGLSGYPLEDVYVIENQDYRLVDKQSTPFSPYTTYYGLGFNGHLSAEVTTESISGVEVTRYYSISGLFYDGNNEDGYGGLFASLGSKAVISNLSIYYSRYSTTVNNMVFGGLTALNYGKIENVSLDIGSENSDKITANGKLIFGGLVGINYGIITNTNSYSTASCSMDIEMTTSSECFVGGICGINHGEIYGNFDTSSSLQQIVLNEAEVSAIVNFNLTASSSIVNSAIGGAVGKNDGKIEYVSVNGKISANSFSNVAGLVGTANYNSQYNNADDEIYSISYSYSTAVVSGYDVVGGAIASVSGEEDKLVSVYYVGAENYANRDGERTFVSASQKVGGFVGFASYMWAKYCYVATYFEGNNGYDVKSSSDNAGAFAYSLVNSTVSACAIKVNVEASGKVSLFVYSSDTTNSVEGIISNGTIKGQEEITTHNVNNSIIGASTYGEIGELDYVRQSGEDCYIVIVINEVEQPLIVTGDITISALVNDNSTEYVDYLKGNQALSFVLFYNDDSTGKYTAEQLNNLNTIDLFSDEIVQFSISPQTLKTNRVNFASYSSSIIRVNKDGTITLLKEGEGKLHISSQLNDVFGIDLLITVISGISEIGLYDSVSLINEIGSDISQVAPQVELLVNDSSTLFVDAVYERNKNNTSYSLDAMENVSIRFSVEKNSELTSALGAWAINEVFTFASKTWVLSPDGTYYYTDVDYQDIDKNSLKINAKKVLDSYIDIEYVPYIDVKYSDSDKLDTIYLENFRKHFALKISNGATDIRLADNLSGEFSLYQHESLVFTVIIDTTFDGDKILSNSDAFMAEDGDFYDKNFNLVASSSTPQPIRDESGKLVAMSMTYTFSYKDKLGNVEENYSTGYNYYNQDTECVEYVYESASGERVPLRFYAQSQPNKVCEVYISIKNKSTLDDLRVNLYSTSTDYPKRSNVNNIIYNETKAYVSVEVYPFYTSYSYVRVSYASRDVNNNMIISQVKYDNSTFTNISTDNPIIYSNDKILVDKTTAQDIFADNSSTAGSGIYSYGKTYFFSITLPGSTPNNASFRLLFEVLNRKKEVISSKYINLTALVRPKVEMSLDSSLQEQTTSDRLYYLPIYTDNVLSVTTINETGKINFDVSIEGSETSPNYESLKSALMPTYSNGAYHLKVFSYTEREDLTSFIGKKVTITATMGSEDITSNASKLEFIITLFTVKNVYISGAKDGLLTLATNNVSPLKLSLDAYYDESVNATTNNWYSDFYSNLDDSNPSELAQKLKSAGYEISDNINGLFDQLCEKIAVLKITKDTVTSSPVFYYDKDDNVKHQLSTNSKHGSLQVERYNNHFALYSNDSDRRYKIYSVVDFIEYSKGNDYSGIANILDYSESGTAQKRFSFEDEKIVSFDNLFNFLNPIPVSSAEEFIEMEEGKDYRLVKDIELKNYEPIDCNVASFDGNGYTIYITSFAYDEMQSGSVEVGLFKSIDSSSIISNVAVYYTPKVVATSTGDLKPENSGTMSISLYNISSLVFGGLSCVNGGVITNCCVKGHVSISLNTTSTSDYPTVPSSVLTAGLVARNSNIITYSKVVDFSITNRGQTGGFVGDNSGRIISCYIDNCAISNLSNSNVGGFCFTNNGEIRECYVQGGRSVNDITIQNTASGISSDGGYVGGFIFNNNGSIYDCYSNIKFVSSYRSAGFVYQESASSVITRCYSISYKNPDDNTTTAFPFAGPTEAVEDRVEVNGILNDCYFIASSGYRTTNFYAVGSNVASATPSNKKATALTLDNFATHTNFTTYDLSLNYSSGNYSTANSRDISYNYVDGYTWVILEGKPVLVSTLTPTYSWQNYLGKVKNYYNEVEYFDSAKDYAYSTRTVLSGVTETTCSLDNTTIYTLLKNDNEKTKEYTFYYSGYQKITLKYSFSTGEDVLIACTYGDDSVIDYVEYNLKKVAEESDETYLEKLTSDKNFRASDTVEIIYNETAPHPDGKIISKVNFKLLESVQYSYNTTTAGSRTNPYLIFDYNSFNYYFTSVSQTDINFYRFITNVDLRRNFTSTSYSTLSGVVQGSYMSVDNIYLSYTNLNDASENRNTKTFGLFSEVSTIASKDTIISNLTFNVAHVVSHTHDFVGVLAGKIEPKTGGKIFINNVNFEALSDATGVFGVHAVGSLAGYMKGEVIIKDISSELSVTANFHQSNPDNKSILYSDDNNVSGLSVVGGIVGIFDVSTISNNSTLRNYNATNISVHGSNIYSGIIAGSVFGVIGKNAVVNYINVSIPNSNGAYISSTGYAGGIAGENRGKILSSSVKYENETSTTNNLHSTLFSRYDYFYNLSTSSTIAIGGLVGYNNGGTISNCLTTLNVRNIYAKMAGGAVGRMTAGRLEYVIASGSVKAKQFMGGLIGMTNTTEFMANGDPYDIYDSSCIMEMPEGTTPITIVSCLAENNYVAADYNYYYKNSTSSGNFAISSFIGLIISNNLEKPEYISFEGQSYCVDGLVATSSSTVVSYYLKPANIATNKSVLETNNSSVVLTDSAGNQIVFPISLESFFYENDNTGVSYTVSQRENPNYEPNFQDRIYTLNSYSNPTGGRLYTKDLMNFSRFYKPTGTETDFEKLIKRYGEFYLFTNGEYIKVVDGKEQAEFYENWGIVSIKEEGSDKYIASANPNDPTQTYYYMDSPSHWTTIAYDSISDYKSSHQKITYYIPKPKLDEITVYRKYTAQNSSGYDQIELSGNALVFDESQKDVFKSTGNSSIDTSNSVYEEDGIAPRVYIVNDNGQYALNALYEFKYTDGESIEHTLEISDVSKYLFGISNTFTEIDINEFTNGTPNGIVDLFKAYDLSYDETNNSIYMKFNYDTDTTLSGYELSCSQVEYSNSFVESIASMKYVYINNIRIPLSTAEIPNIRTSDEIKVYIEITGEDTGTITFKKVSGDIITTYDGGKINVVTMSYKQRLNDGTKYHTTITDVECEYSYSLNDGTDVSLSRTELLNSTTYTLNIATKRIIYKALDNGNWAFAGDFYTSSTKYPENKEIAEIYLWTMFANTSTNDLIITIRTPEDLATLAYQVNVKKLNFGSKDITLTADLDLSGKYWVPIGTEVNPFTGNFNGGGHVIKYATVNEKSTIDISSGDMLGTLSSAVSLPKYAGLFGKVESSTIYNLTVSGGQISGMYAGGVVAYADGPDTKLYKIVNNNIASGVAYAGGVVGYIDGGSMYSLTSNGSVVLDTSNGSLGSQVITYTGGIAGYANGIKVGADSDTLETSNNAQNIFANNGSLSVLDKKTSYITNVLMTNYCGGLFGLITASTIDAYLMGASGCIYNNGRVNVSSNANQLVVGGVFGKIDWKPTDGSNQRVNTLNNISNTSKSVITIIYTNNYTADEPSQSFIGGIAGISTCSMFRCNNEADIELRVIDYTANVLVVGGLVGECNVYNNDTNLIDKNLDVDLVNEYDFYVRECFNFSNILVSKAMTSDTKIIAGGIVGGANLQAIDDANTEDDNDFPCNNIDVIDCYNMGSIESNNICTSYLAGIVGLAYLRKVSSSLYSTSSDAISQKLNIEKCMNLAEVHIDKDLTNNVVSAITVVIDGDSNYVDCGEIDPPTDEVIRFCSNYYLKGSCYAGSSTYYALGKANKNEKSFAETKTSDQLKERDTFISRQADDEKWDFDNIWVQQYDSWYPTLKNNHTSIMWEGRQESLEVQDNIRLIKNADELANLAYQINEGYLNSSNLKFRLASSIDLSNRYWTPIGTQVNPFRGVFDGAGYTIKNVTIGSASNINYGGLFGYTDGATISNLGLENVIISGVVYAGGLVCFADNTRLEKVYSDFSIYDDDGSPATNIGIKANNGAGGLVYELKNSLNSAGKGMSRSYNNIPVATETNGNSAGLVGMLINSSIDNSYNNYYGHVTTSDSSQISDVIGKIEDNTSYFTNVFSLASKFGAPNSTPTLYSQSEENPSPHIEKSDLLPYFNNLVSPNGIWTNGYGLNPNQPYPGQSYTAISFPSIKGLNKEWKNALSENISGVDSGNQEDAMNKLINLNSGDSDSYAVALGSAQYSANNSGKYRTIYTAKDLALLAQQVNNGASTIGIEYILMNDIDLSSMYWTPIGINDQYAFSGTFNFNGHVISNLTIDRNEMFYAGLFGYTRNAHIINGYLDNVFINVHNTLKANENNDTYVGALVGYANNTNIYNICCSVRLFCQTRAKLYIGGLVGTASSASTKFNISNVRVYGDIGVDVEEYADYVQQLPDKDAKIKSSEIHIMGISMDTVSSGGVIGLIRGGGEIEESLLEYATNNANVVNISPNYDAYAGGVVGKATHTTIDKCQNKAKVKTYCGHTDILGGVVGYASNSTISNCSLYDTAYIEGRLQSSGMPTTYISIVGGIVGKMDGGTISFCATRGTTYSNYIDSNTVFLGAVIGYGLNHSIDQDKTCVYNNNNTGFSDAFGTGDEVGASTLFYNDLDLIANPKDEMIQTTGVFDSKIWDTDGKVLMSEVVYVVGSGNRSFKLTEPTDHGLLENRAGLCVPQTQLDTVKLEEESLVAGLMAQTYYLVQDLGQCKLDGKISSATASMTLSSLIDSNISDRALIIYVSGVETEP